MPNDIHQLRAEYVGVHVRTVEGFEGRITEVIDDGWVRVSCCRLARTWRVLSLLFCPVREGGSDGE